MKQGINSTYLNYGGDTVVRNVFVAYLATVKTLRANWCTVTPDGLAYPPSCITSQLNGSSVNRSK